MVTTQASGHTLIRQTTIPRWEWYGRNRVVWSDDSKHSSPAVLQIVHCSPAQLSGTRADLHFRVGFPRHPTIYKSKAHTSAPVQPSAHEIAEAHSGSGLCPRCVQRQNALQRICGRAAEARCKSSGDPPSVITLCKIANLKNAVLHLAAKEPT